jgi:hypothetical protein
MPFVDAANISIHRAIFFYEYDERTLLSLYQKVNAREDLTSREVLHIIFLFLAVENYRMFRDDIKGQLG